MGVSRNPAIPVSGSPAYSPDNLPAYRGGGGAGPAPFTPDDVLAGVTNSFWARPLDSGVLYQDASLTTPADETADPIGGVDNQSSIGASTLSQATTADKFKVASDGRMERDGIVNTQRLLFGSLTIDFSNGFCVAMDFESSGNGALFGSGTTNEFQAFRSTTSLSMRIGSTTTTTVSSVLDARRRVIISGDATDYNVYIDGTEYGPYSTGINKTSHTSLCLGTVRPDLMTGQPLFMGNFLIAEKDLRANVADIDAWLGGA